jgi:hypothetical protein
LQICDQNTWTDASTRSKKVKQQNRCFSDGHLITAVFQFERVPESHCCFLNFRAASNAVSNPD